MTHKQSAIRWEDVRFSGGYPPLSWIKLQEIIKKILKREK